MQEPLNLIEQQNTENQNSLAHHHETNINAIKENEWRDKKV